MKKCTKCGGKGPFYKTHQSKDGLHSWCKKCADTQKKEWAKNNPKRRKEICRKWNLKKRYGNSELDWFAEIEKQKRRCAICGTKKPDRGSWCTDHDHETKKFRGILCHSCNLAIGLLKDDVLVVESAARYVRNNNV